MLWSSLKGYAKAELKDGSFIILRGCLLVPKLGANLLSVRRIASNANLLGTCTDDHMWVFKDGANAISNVH